MIFEIVGPRTHNGTSDSLCPKTVLIDDFSKSLPFSLIADISLEALYQII